MDNNDNNNDALWLYLEKRDASLLEVKQQEPNVCYLDVCTLIINRHLSVLYRFDFLPTTERILTVSL